ncbi:glycoside hydrolase family 3 N-terminal domain-containing protein [Streptomyces iakyrus]|uniref:glycoside hydrolase family 3 N-terminal domain-containing protein n=1 Tax=Streptomyces iakyrus TaxID=68219 RepID=UPI003D9008E4
MALDPRWGWVHATYGEDPYLCTALSVAFTHGLQGDDLSRGVLATGKHFLGNALPVGGVNTSAYEGGMRRPGISSPTRSRPRSGSPVCAR